MRVDLASVYEGSPTPVARFQDASSFYILTSVLFDKGCTLLF